MYIRIAFSIELRLRVSRSLGSLANYILNLKIDREYTKIHSNTCKISVCIFHEQKFMLMSCRTPDPKLFFKIIGDTLCYKDLSIDVY